MSLIPTRLFYQKKNRLKYISHLDTMNVFSKAISRSRLPVWYTEGYNPHIYISIPFPLSLGYEGLKEPMEIRLIEPVEHKEVLIQLNKLLPQDMSVVELGNPVFSPSDVEWAKYKIMIELEKTENICHSFDEFYKQKDIIVEKKTKKRSMELDIKPYLKETTAYVNNDFLIIESIIATGEKININPRLLVNGFSRFIDMNFDGIYVTREKIMITTDKEFA